MWLCAWGGDGATPEFQCPQCGVIYAKFTLARAKMNGGGERVRRDEQPKAWEELPRVVVVGVDIPLGEIVKIMLYVSLASIPAGIVIWLACYFIVFLVGIVRLIVHI